MAVPVMLAEHCVQKEVPLILTSPEKPVPVKSIFLSNIDQTVAFPVETVFFYGAPPRGRAADLAETVKKAVSEVLLIPYYFMAGRLSFNMLSKRLELVCNNAGMLFTSATSSLRLDELGDLALPNYSFRHLVIPLEGFQSLSDTPVFTLQVTKFRCGGYSLGFVKNHSTLDGISTARMLENLAAICRGEGLKYDAVDMDRSCIQARSPPVITFDHPEYTVQTDIAAAKSSFTSPAAQALPSAVLEGLQKEPEYRTVSFSYSAVEALMKKAAGRCSTFEAVVAHIWKARAHAVFGDSEKVSTVLFAVDIRNRMSPPLPAGFAGNAVVTASARATVRELSKKPLSFAIGLVHEAIEVVDDEFVRSVIDWLEVHRGVPSVIGGDFFVSAWLKLPFHELDLGWGKPLYSGPLVGRLHEFVLLLPAEGGVNVWIALESEKMDKFLNSVLEY